MRKMPRFPSRNLLLSTLFLVGTTWSKATLPVISPGNEGANPPRIAARFSDHGYKNWPIDHAGSNMPFVDLSGLNKHDTPAGKHGAIKVLGDRLVYPNNQEIKFWGTNVTAYAIFTTPKNVVRHQAKRLAALGYNLVRIHHHDSPWVTPNVFGDTGAHEEGKLSPKYLDKIDWWIKCLKDEGIYVWLDLHAQRSLHRETSIEGLEEIRKGRNVADLKGYNYVNPSIQKSMQSFNSSYLNHVNSYTGLAYKDEPSVLALMITNENDLTHHFGNLLLPDKNVPHHSEAYLREARHFAKQHKLPQNKIWKSWESGPSKIFLNDLEYRFNKSMIDHLVLIGSAKPLVTTSTWGNPLFSLPALTAGDIIDVHAYGSYGQLEKNPFLHPNLTDWMSSAQVIGKPLSVTEWNADPFPTEDRHTLPLFIAARASHQGWDALMHYAYTQESISGAGKPSNWHSHNDPSLLPMLSAAALMYRQGHVKEAQSSFVFDMGSATWFNQEISPLTARALRTIPHQGKLQIALPESKELPWLKRTPVPPESTLIRDPQFSPLPENSRLASSDTGELTHNWALGIYTINTPKTQAALGWIGEQSIKLESVHMDLKTRHASVAVQSMDERPIRLSRNILISIGKRSVPQEGNKAPFLTEPVDGVMSIQALAGLRAYRNGPLNQKIELPTEYKNGRYIIQLNLKHNSQWIHLH